MAINFSTEEERRKLGNRIAIRLMEVMWDEVGGGPALVQSSKIGHVTGQCRAICYMAWLNKWYSCYAVPSLSRNL
jgi:hypothetical protein